MDDHVRSIEPSVGMLPVSEKSIVEFAAAEKPRLLVIVDAEEEFDWSKPFSADTTSVTTMKLQHVAQRIYARHRLVPSYVVDYAVASAREGYAPLLEHLHDGTCEIGAQLHPWVTPPHVEELGERNSFPCNLPEELEHTKLVNLTEKIEASFGVRPILYRAGRYGAGVNTPKILRRLGYTIDCSVLPRIREGSPFAPDYADAPVRPYWIGHGTDLLEIPVTQSVMGIARAAKHFLAPRIFSKSGMFLKLPGVMARLRLYDEIRISPEGTTLREAKRLTRFLLEGGQKVFVISYHSPSLGIGHTPYVRNQADLSRFIAWIEGYLEFFFGEIGGVAATPGQIRELALRARGFGGPSSSNPKP